MFIYGLNLNRSCERRSFANDSKLSVAQMFAADDYVVRGPFFHEAAAAVLAKVKPHLAPKDMEQDFINYMDRFTVLD